jgi:hypothetical protein
MLKWSLALCSCIAVSLVGCSKPNPDTASTPSQPTASASVGGTPDTPIDACSLLTSEEIKQVMGETVTEAKPQRQNEEGFVISQCLFLLPESKHSVTLRLVQRGEGADARDPRQVWQETFARDLEKAIKERKKAPPERVPNVGDEAFWLGGPQTGGLYVLKGNRHFRLGFGGEPNQPLKIEKATKLAGSILGRL